MAGPYGVTLTGFKAKPFEAILEDIIAAQHAEISPTLDLSENTPWGKDARIKAREIHNVWLELEKIANGTDPDAAQGFLLEALGKLTGTERRGASYSTVTLSCDLDEGAELESGIHFAAVDGNPASLWTPVENYKAGSSGSQPVTFRAELKGAIEASNGTITVIHTSVPGWNSVTNPQDAEAGRTVDDDPTLRQRREDQAAAAGSVTVKAVKSDLLEIDGVISVQVFENDSDDWVDGMSPHSLEALIYDGETPTVSNDEIAQVLWNARGAGIKTVGSETGNATDASGNTHVMRFSRPTYKQVYIEIEIEAGSGYVGDAAVKAHIVQEASKLYSIGDSGRRRQVDSLVFGLEGVVDVTDFRWGFAVSPTGTGNLSVNRREVLSFDTSRVEVTS
jgi:uncharacterized phage protein gp47/JayE